MLALESRRATEMAELVRRRGGVPQSAPSMREIPLEDSPAAHDFARRLGAGEIDVVILLTGVGTRALVEAVRPVVSKEAFVAALARPTLVARGPKPVAALRELGLAPSITVSEPNTWREILATLDARVPVAGKRVALQEYGLENTELVRGLVERGADVLRVPVYRWALPEDLGPLREAIRSLLAGEIAVLLVTSATQVDHLYRVAGDDAEALTAALRTVVVASIGPVASEALRDRGIDVDFEASPPKMGPLVLGVAEQANGLLAAKKASLASRSKAGKRDGFSPS